MALYSLYRPVLRTLRLVLKSLVRDPTDVISSSAFATAWQALLKANEYSQAAYTELTPPSDRDYLSSPRNKKFLEYLVDREMITHSNLITTRRDELLSDPGVKLPLVFFVDFSQVIPPNIKVYEDVDFIDRWFDSHSNKRIPLIAPFIELRSGFQMRPISISNERSGSMFGWLDEDTDSDSGQYVGSVLDADGDE
ncbi:hypothetical protein H0H93_013264 [Arthromyces matolae]|nr:hypothetical protein H0H93_013264 [Arthromyces matolae]